MVAWIRRLVRSFPALRVWGFPWWSVQWLRLYTSNAGCVSLIPGWGMKILYAKKKKKKKRSGGFLSDTSGKEPACQCRRLKETLIQSLGREDPLEEGVATHCSILA